MTFQADQIDRFLEVFEGSKRAIRAFEGCQYLELWQEKAQPNVLFTYSWWLSEAHLENYRQSALFRETWEKTKILFAEKPAAWTLQSRDQLP